MKDSNAFGPASLTIEFDVLSDFDQSVIRDYRVQFTLPADLQSVHLDVFDLDLGVQNADGSWILPAPATFVISTEGIIVAADVAVDHRTRVEPSAVLQTLDGLSSSGLA